VVWVDAVAIGCAVVDQICQNVGDYLVSSNRDGMDCDDIGLEEQRKGRETEAHVNYPNGGQDSQYVGHDDLGGDARARVEEVTHIKVMGRWLAQVERGRAGSSEEQTENRDDTEETHGREELLAQQ